MRTFLVIAAIVFMNSIASAQQCQNGQCQVMPGTKTKSKTVTMGSTCPCGPACSGPSCTSCGCNGKSARPHLFGHILQNRPHLFGRLRR